MIEETPSTDRSDADLLMLREGGVDALAMIFNELRPSLRRMLRLRTRQIQHREDGSDVIQDAWIEATRRLSEYLDNPQVSVRVWLRRLTRQMFARVWRDNVGTQKRTVGAEQYFRIGSGGSSDELIVELSASMAQPEEVVVRQEQKEQLRRGIDQLSDLDREILVLRHIEGLSVRDAAQELEIAIETAKKRYHRALARLAKSMTLSHGREVTP